MPHRAPLRRYSPEDMLTGSAIRRASGMSALFLAPNDSDWEDRSLRRIPNRLRRLYAVSTTVLAICIAITAFQEAWMWDFSPKDCDVVDDRTEECQPSQVVILLVTCKQVLVTVTFLTLLNTRVWAIVRYRRRLCQARAGDPRLPRGYRVPGDHWTAVASADIFEETARMVALAQLIVLAAVGSTTIIATVAQVRNTFQRYERYTGQEQLNQACCPSCAPFDESCPCDMICKVSKAGIESFLTLNVGLMTCLFASLIFIPLAVWSPVADAAFNGPNAALKAHHKVLKCTRALPVPVAVFAALTSVCIAVYSFKFVAPAMTHSPVLWYLVLCANVVSSIGLLGLLLWSVGIGRLLTLPILIARICFSAIQSARGSLSSTDDMRRRRMAKRITRLWRCNGSWRYRQLALLCACVYCFIIEALDIKSQGVPELYIGRVLSFVLLLFTRDAETEPEDLAREGAGFGLLVNARLLRAALHAHLRGEVYTGRMPRYKATQLRMRETLAISYRWHDENSVDLGNGLELNITRWQAAAILQGIKTTRCLYCWIDNLAIPSGRSLRVVQKTLLSRMMAVYSSALVTLVLRSRELEGDRYHQRIWTLQEFCASRRLIVVTEPEPATHGSKDEEAEPADLARAAVLDDEDFVIEELRRDFMDRQEHCEPVWLIDGGAVGTMRRIDASEATRIWETYQELARSLHCRYRSDTVRALYPLLWNRPAESELELVSLLEAVQEVHGIPQDGLVQLLYKFSNRDFKQAQSGNFNDLVPEGALDSVCYDDGSPQADKEGRPPSPMLAWTAENRTFDLMTSCPE